MNRDYNLEIIIAVEKFRCNPTMQGFDGWLGPQPQERQPRYLERSSLPAGTCVVDYNVSSRGSSGL